MHLKEAEKGKRGPRIRKILIIIIIIVIKHKESAGEH